MALARVNMVDAVAKHNARMARARTLTVRTGTVTAVASAGIIPVRFGSSSASVPCAYLASYIPAVNDVVAVITESDVWIVIGKVAT